MIVRILESHAWRVVPLFFVGGIFILPPRLGANEWAVEYDPSTAGQLVPREETSVEVREEFLDIAFRNLFQGEDFWSLDTDVPTVAWEVGALSAPPVRVEVTARYRLYNPSREPRTLELAFPIVGGGPEDEVATVRNMFHRWENESLLPDVRRGVRSRVTFDGEPIEYDYVSFESLFGAYREEWAANIREWLEQWPSTLGFLDAPPKPAPTPKPVPNRDPNRPREIPRRYERREDVEGASWPTGECYATGKPRHLTPKPCHLRWAMRCQALFHEHIEDWDLDFLSFAHAFLYPEAEDPVREALERWEVDDVYLEVPTGKMFDRDPLHFGDIPHWDFSRVNRRVDFLTYRPTLPPRAESTIEVTYSHLVNAEIYPIKDRSDLTDGNGYWDTYQYTFQYLLRISEKWEHFGPIHVTLSIDAKEPYAFSLPLHYDGRENGRDRYSYTIPQGSELTQNLHVGIGGIYLKVDEDSEYPGFIDAGRFWDCYQANPSGPFAAAYLERMAQKIRGGAIANEEEYAFWCDTLEIDSGATEKTELDEKIAERLLAMAAAKQPEVARKD